MSTSASELKYRGELSRPYKEEFLLKFDLFVKSEPAWDNRELNYESEKNAKTTKRDELMQSFLKISQENLTNLWSNKFDDAWDKV